MTGSDKLTAAVAALSGHQSERLLQAIMERMLSDIGNLAADNEESARELIAACVTATSDELVLPDEIVPPTTEPEVFVRSTLALLAADPSTAGLVESTLASLPDDTQMFVDPITATLVLGAMVAFLQTKFDLTIERKGGKLDVKLVVSKNATSDESVGKVLDAVRRASSG